MASLSPINKTMGPVEWGLLLLLSMVWGGSFFFVEVALEDLPPFTVVFARVSLAAAMLVALIYLTGRRMPGERRFWGAILVLAMFTNLIPFSLIVWGQTQITGALASILNATTLIFTVIIAHFFTGDERMTLNRLAGVLLGFAGVAVLVGPDALQGLGANVLGQLAVVGAAVSYSIGGVFARRLSAIPPLMISAGQLTTSSVLMLPIMLIVDRPWTLELPGAPAWGAMLGLSLVSTAAAYLMYFRILAVAGASNLMLVTLLIPVSAIALGVSILGEVLLPIHLAGMGLIGLGLLCIDDRALSMLRRRFRSKAGVEAKRA